MPREQNRHKKTPTPERRSLSGMTPEDAIRKALGTPPPKKPGGQKRDSLRADKKK